MIKSDIASVLTQIHIHIHRQHLRRHGDIIKRTVGGYFVVQGRADDTMNLGGIKVPHSSQSFLSFVSAHDVSYKLTQ